ncbi:hypothetical protein PG993_011928 [Apiospora rasikravindrae]|uniref:Uncharacterized protein n=1 Tax=Apiospora rasikravindrae TaxID=990691 RepID=A0ABR1S106_9PEZI
MPFVRLYRSRDGVAIAEPGQAGQSKALPLIPSAPLPITESSIDTLEDFRRHLCKANKVMYRRLKDKVDACVHFSRADEKLFKEALGELLGVKFHLEIMGDRLQAEREKYMDGRANLNREIDEWNMLFDLVQCIKDLTQAVFDRQVRSTCLMLCVRGLQSLLTRPAEQGDRHTPRSSSSSKCSPADSHYWTGSV